MLLMLTRFSTINDLASNWTYLSRNFINSLTVSLAGLTILHWFVVLLLLPSPCPPLLRIMSPRLRLLLIHLTVLLFLLVPPFGLS